MKLRIRIEDKIVEGAREYPENSIVLAALRTREEVLLVATLYEWGVSLEQLSAKQFEEGAPGQVTDLPIRIIKTLSEISKDCSSIKTI